MYAVLQEWDVTAYKVKEKVNLYQKSVKAGKISRKLLEGHFVVLHLTLA